jgi:hypothetical protein
MTKKAEKAFSNLVPTLSAAELASKSANGNATQARAEKSDIAVKVIIAAHVEALEISDVRRELLDAGVLKGTVSKIATILQGLADGAVTLSDVKSLNGAYNAVKAVSAIVAGPVTGALAPGVPFAAPGSGAVATTPEQAFDIIIDAIRSIVDPDEALKTGGEWMARISTGISDVLKARDDEEDE